MAIMQNRPVNATKERIVYPAGVYRAHWVAPWPFTLQAAPRPFHQLFKYFYFVKRLGFVEAAGRENESYLQSINYTNAPPWCYYHLTEREKTALEHEWYRPQLTSYSGLAEGDRVTRVTAISENFPCEKSITSVTLKAMGDNIFKILVFWGSLERPLIQLGPDENCEDLRKLLSILRIPLKSATCPLQTKPLINAFNHRTWLYSWFHYYGFYNSCTWVQDHFAFHRHIFYNVNN
jgi:hypothetical protein